MVRLAAVLLTLWSFAVPAVAPAMTLQVENRFGDVRVETIDEPDLLVRVLREGALASSEEMRITREPNRIVIVAQPIGGEPLDLDIRLPLGFALEAETDAGAIAIEGMIHLARLRTDTGAVRIRTVWSGAHVQIDAQEQPDRVFVPREQRFSRATIDIAGGRKLWRMRDVLDLEQVVYGDYRVETRSPAEIVLSEFDPPSDWPLKFHWQAPAVLESLSAPPPPRSPKSGTADEPSPKESPFEEPPVEGAALFRSDVRMVNFVLAVGDKHGRPVVDLKADEFSVAENGEPQEVSFAGSDQVGFNLAILLDLSGSAKPDRARMQAAAQGFLDIARPGDKVAVYALSGGMFHVISRLTDDHELVRERIRRLPDVSGASPLYDIITLAYAEELHGRAGERNALIVISDGIDNQISKQERPSMVKLKRLTQAAEELDALIYPIFLRSGERFGRNWSKKARENLEKLAEASGGRLFPAGSAEDLAPVFPEVEAELRSVYSVAYYPKDQDFDGSWRNVAVTIDRPDVVARSRKGYYAR